MYKYVFVIITAFLTSSQNSTCLSFRDNHLIHTLENERDVQYTGKRWESIVNFCNYAAKKEIIDTLQTLLVKQGLDFERHGQLAVQDKYKLIDQALQDKKPETVPLSDAVKNKIQQVLSTSFNKPTSLRICAGTVEDMDISPATIYKTKNNEAILLLHHTNPLSTQLLGTTKYAFDQLPDHMQDAIIHHECAHIPSWDIDAAILELSNACFRNQPEHLTSVYTELESCVDTTAVVRSLTPVETAKGLHEFLTTYAPNDASNTQRIKILEILQDGLSKEPQAHYKKMIEASKKHASRAFATVAAVLQRLPK